MKLIKGNLDLANMFESLSASKGLYHVWSDCMFLMAAAISNPFDKGVRKEEREQQYLEIIKSYSPAEQKIIIDIFNTIVSEFEENPNQDLLGTLFTELEFGNKHLGQFFTPYNICVMMAKMTASDGEKVKEVTKENGYVTVNDCACGGGATLIAYANSLKEMGINYQTNCFFVAQDIDYTTALICYIQLSLLGCAGYVKIGNTLLNPPVESQKGIVESSNIWIMPMTYRDIWTIKFAIKQFKDLLIK